uniref:Link domain-containing protein n=1 Tax=viral metagenome TaxID=1070528 RepID=A0A6C0KIG4_9ZZZZ
MENTNINKVLENLEDTQGNTSATATTKTEETTETSNDTKLINSIFSTSNLILVAWFLGVYFVSYFLLGFFFKSDSPGTDSNLSRTIDILMLSCFVIVVMATYYSMTDYQKENYLTILWGKFIKFLNAPISIVEVTSFIVIFYTIVYLFRFPMTAETKPMSVMLIEGIAWIIFIIIAIIDFFKYVLTIPIIDLLKSIFGDIPEEPKKQEIDNVQKDEVFNISNNLYTYDDAQAICGAYDAKLATYDQVEAAYNDGAEWCNYGWSDGQMIFFPTQKATWDKLQKTKDHKNNCGRPGVNGGYIGNPYLKFGVNCYGKKPKASDADIARMNAQKGYVYPKSKADIELENKIKYWKDNADKLLKINAFNTNKWFESWTGGVSSNTVVSGNTLAK